MIGFPPCTFLCNSGVRWLYGGRGKEIDKSRWSEMEKAANFFKSLLQAPIERICVENPIMHKYAKEIIIENYDQIIDPFSFGHNETKATCLWLKNLPALKKTHSFRGIPYSRVHFASPGPDRWKERSRTLSGIAEAMASQWG